ncbi:hypothetical protein [Streptomyces sp. NPDC000410]|uniref:hypothetical protein n=1 Tax=Streptomyces sp. NPDC000410 TaxID=3154254 RepID=UPI0033259517
MNVTRSTVSLTVSDMDATHDFLTTHLGDEVAMADDGFASLTRTDAAVAVAVAEAE